MGLCCKRARVARQPTLGHHLPEDFTRFARKIATEHNRRIPESTDWAPAIYEERKQPPDTGIYEPPPCRAGEFLLRIQEDTGFLTPTDPDHDSATAEIERFWLRWANWPENDAQHSTHKRWDPRAGIERKYWNIKREAMWDHGTRAPKVPRQGGGTAQHRTARA